MGAYTLFTTYLLVKISLVLITPKMELIGKPAPTFETDAVIDGKITKINLKDYKGKFVVLLFYPLDFTFVCPTEILSFSDNVDKFKELNCTVLGISTDSAFSHLAWIEKPRKEGGISELAYPLVADKSMAISKAYGVLREDGIAHRGLFVIDAEQNIRHITVNDEGIGRCVNEAIRQVEAIQFHQKHGEVCPANWKPGQKTMIPDPTKSKDYFKAAN